MTGVDSPLALNPKGPTVLMGYHPDLRMFAGFDIKRHRTFTTGSPSVQISINTVNDALQNGLGLAFNTKNNLEIALGVRPDQFLNYVRLAEKLHEYGKDAQTLSLLQKAAEAEDLSKQDIAVLAPVRQKILTEINRYSRDASFRQQVLNAYGHRCAVTRFQMNLVDAAHILPVPSGKSSEHVTNGIALSPTVHRAFDNGLIYLDKDYTMHLNQEKIKELSALKLSAGINQIDNLLQGKIHLPVDHAQRPNPQYIIEANHYRHIPGYY